MLDIVRRNITEKLWQHYCQSTPEMQSICTYLNKRNKEPILLDHMALIDLPSAHSGIPVLSQLFSLIGYTKRGADYLPDKQNDFLWMADANARQQWAKEALPQVVVADFRLEVLPEAVKSIIEKYAAHVKPAPLSSIESLVKRTEAGDPIAATLLTTCITQYLTERGWPLPSRDEFYTVQAFNELIAWVLVFGHRPNHFAIAVHHCEDFTDLAHFNHTIATECGIALNQEGGIIKGGIQRGIAQSATDGVKQKILLSDGEIMLPTGFAEFVWRYPCQPIKNTPHLWEDYFTGFIASQANHVIESLYLGEKEDNLSEVQ